MLTLSCLLGKEGLLLAKVSIGVVTYNSEKKICDLLDSVNQYTSDISFDVYIVDNNSTDRTVDVIQKNYKTATVLQMDHNLGFGGGHNRLLPLVDSEYHMIVNPDIVLHSNAISELAHYLDTHPDVVMVTPKILNMDGTEQYLPKREPKLRYLIAGRLAPYSRFFCRIRDQYTLKSSKIEQPIDIDFSTGCFSMIRTETFRKIGGFDERFFMYLEDADLTLRAKKYGRAVFNPQISVVHGWERSSAKDLKYLFIHINSMMKFISKWRKNKKMGVSN